MTQDNRTHGHKKEVDLGETSRSGTLARLAQIHLPRRRASSFRRRRSAAADCL